jgi:hypothetical protein
MPGRTSRAWSAQFRFGRPASFSALVPGPKAGDQRLEGVDEFDETLAGFDLHPVAALPCAVQGQRRRS